MKFYSLSLLFCLYPFFAPTGLERNETKDYLNYHQQIIEAESLITEENFKGALDKYESIFSTYDFVFLRDYQVATQLALYLKEKEKAIIYLEEGIAAGWELKSIKKNEFLKQLGDDPEWKTVISNYGSLRGEYEAGLNHQIQAKVRKMFSKDQWKAIGALLRIGDKAQERYAEKKFAPHSETQMAKLIEILESHGYPGEKLIGNDFWMSTILSHHNSISSEYSKNDTLYKFIKPKLIKAIKEGQMSPYEYALIDDWHKAISSERTEPGYGFLSPPYQSTLTKTNNLRQKIGLRTIELRNKLVDVEKRTGMKFYLPDWVEGKIIIDQK